MKHFLNRSNITLLIEQAIFSIFNFIVVINLYNDISTLEVASMGVNITALYGAVSVARNLISGEFTQSEFPVNSVKLESLLRIICIRTLAVSPFVLMVMVLSCYFTKTDLRTTMLLLIISVEVIFVDNFRQVQILYSKLQFMSVNLILSILFTCLLVISFKPENQPALMFWLFSFLFYVLIALARYSKIFRRLDQEWFVSSKFVSRKSITVESFTNHSLFYFYNLFFFQINPLLSGEIRLITAWIVNAASSLYITLNNYYTIRLVNYDSSSTEQKSINLLAFLTLTVTALSFSVLHFFVPLTSIKIDALLTFGTCVSSFTFFVHSRISVLYLHAMPFPKFLRLRSTTWAITLSMQLLTTYFLGKEGFVIGSVISCIYVIKGYNRALANSEMLKGDFK